MDEALKEHCGRIDVITFGQSLHWMVDRLPSVASALAPRHGSIFVAGYSFPYFAPSQHNAVLLNKLFYSQFYVEILKSRVHKEGATWWDCDRRLVDGGFAGTALTGFTKCKRINFYEAKEMKFGDYVGYLRTMSAYNKLITKCEDPLPQLVSSARVAEGEMVRIVIPFSGFIAST